MSKTEQLQLRVSPEEKARIREAAARAGVDMSEWVLGRLFPPAGERFGELTAALAAAVQPSVPLAALGELLGGLPADRFEAAVSMAPEGLSPYLANHVAALVEHTAYLKGVAPPDWAVAVVPLDEPVFATRLEGLRLRLLVESPPAFRRRNIFLNWVTRVCG